MENETKKFEVKPVSFGQYVILAAEEFKRETGVGGKVEFFLDAGQQMNIFNPLVKTMTAAYKVTLWQQEVKRETFKTPLNWWEHFKERWFSWRMKKWFPVKYEEFDIILNALYAYKDLAFPNERVIWRYEKEIKP